MNLSDIQSDPFFIKFIQKMAKMLGEQYQKDAVTMTADQIYEDKEFFPMFNPERHNYKDKPAGYVCRSPRGAMVKLIQPYDSDIYPQDPEELPAQWGYYWSSNPANAQPFISSATSTYATGDVCLYDGKIYRSLIDNNVHSPEAYPQGWEEVTTEE